MPVRMLHERFFLCLSDFQNYQVYVEAFKETLFKPHDERNNQCKKKREDRVQHDIHIKQTVTPNLLVLSDTSTKDRPAKRRAIEAIKKSLESIKEPLVANESLEQLTSSLLICTESQIETVREQSIQILKRYI